MKLKLSEIADAVQGQLMGDDLTVTGVSIDTRTYTPASFISLSPARISTAMTLPTKPKQPAPPP